MAYFAFLNSAETVDTVTYYLFYPAYKIHRETLFGLASASDDRRYIGLLSFFLLFQSAGILWKFLRLEKKKIG
jgi:hypothetical protein